MIEIVSHYADQHRALADNLAGGETDWLTAQRESAITAFQRVGFPSARDENWKYTSLRPITASLFNVAVSQTAPAADTQAEQIPGLDSYRLVFVDGFIQPSLSNLPVNGSSFTLGSLHQLATANFSGIGENLIRALAEDVQYNDGFDALNIAFSADGYVIDIPAKAQIDKPIELVFIVADENVASQPRNQILIGNQAKAQIVERYLSVSPERKLSNSTTKIHLANNANLEYYLIQNPDSATNLVTSTSVMQEQGSWFGSRTITLGGGLVRNNLKVDLCGPTAHCDMLGLYNVSGKQHVDNFTNVVHQSPHCTSREVYKGVLDQRSRAVFHGRIKVAEGAQKTDATQSNNNLLLSANAEVDTKPQLEIYADDVKCAHGATVGQIDETALFYLRSRGLDAAAARSLLTFAFVNDVLHDVKIDALKSYLESSLAEKLLADD